MPATLGDWLQSIGATPVAIFFRDSTIAYVTLNASHICSIAVVVGSILALDLRVLGLFRTAPLAALAHPLSRVSAGGLVAAIATGTLLFSVRPLAYAQNPAFLCKVLLVALGVLNAVVLRAGRNWREALEGEVIPDAVRVAAFRSILIWAGAILAGRWIGFLQ